MNPLSPEQVKEQIVSELEIGHLPEPEQEQIIATLAEALLERATTVIMAKMPEAEFAHVDTLAESNDQEALKAKIMEFVPDAPQIIDQVVRDGIAEYKQLVEQEKADGGVPEEEMGATSVGEPVAEDSETEPIQSVTSMQADTPPMPEPEPTPAPVVKEENFVVDESGEAKPMDEGTKPASPLINPNSSPEQPAY